jgi:hypothetical protein
MDGIETSSKKLCLCLEIVNLWGEFGKIVIKGVKRLGNAIVGESRGSNRKAKETSSGCTFLRCLGS